MSVKSCMFPVQYKSCCNDNEIDLNRVETTKNCICNITPFSLKNGTKQIKDLFY